MMKSCAVLVGLLIASIPIFANAAACDDFRKSVAGTGSAEKKLKGFLDVQWKYLMGEFPEWATYVGERGGNDRWTDLSVDAIERRKKEVICQQQALRRIDRRRLSPDSRLTLDLALRAVDLTVRGQKFPEEYLVLDQMGGVQVDMADMLFSMPKASAEDYRAMITRLEKAPARIAQTKILLAEGLRRKVTPVKIFLQKVPAQFDQVLTDDVMKSPLYEPFADIRLSISEADKAALQSRAREVISSKVYPAMKDLKTFLEKEYIPGSRENIAWSEMPDGKAWYAHRVEDHTTTAMTPSELHELGLREVARIKSEMEAIRKKVGFKGDMQAFHKFLLTDPQFYYGEAKELMTGYREIAKRIDPELPKLFGRLPRLPYGVREMPAYKAAAAPTAYYMGGSPTSGRAGWFEANTHDLKARPKWGMEALTIHEAVPGHHLQIALAQEIEGLPPIRRNSGPTSFIEGWGLYAESLGDEMGMYQDPYSKYGALAYEMWRAVRLVVDTGMHDKGWSRDKALAYFKEMQPKSQLEAEVEIDRYITMPAQALAYKVGQLKFRELRTKAEKTLGDKFDVRAFHDEVLRHGAIPMNVLEAQFDEWLKEQTVKTRSKG